MSMSTERPPQPPEAETESPYILIDESGVRHVLLSTTCEGLYASAEVTVLLAAFDASTIAPAVVLHRLTSDSTNNVRLELTQEEMNTLVAGYQAYLHDRDGTPDERPDPVLPDLPDPGEEPPVVS
jgi:hypothetical protein